LINIIIRFKFQR